MSTLPESHAPRSGEAVEEAPQAAHYERKQQWKQLPGNRYTAEQLRRMAENMGPFTIVEQEPDVMHLD